MYKHKAFEGFPNGTYRVRHVVDLGSWIPDVMGQELHKK